MSRTPAVDGEVIVDSGPDYEERQHFVTITRKEYNELIHDSELLRCLKEYGLEDSDVYNETMKTFYGEKYNEDDWRSDK